MTDNIIRILDYTNEIIQIAEVFDLILLDLDDVVLTTKQYFCSSQWYTKYLDESIDLLTSEEIIHKTNICMVNSEFIPVSQNLIDNFSTLAKEKKVFALTARSALFNDITDKHLQEANMEFSKCLSNHDLIQNGVIYSGFKPGAAEAEDKGVTLKKLIDQGIFGKIRSVILIDDLLVNLKKVQKALEGSEIEFLGIHFTKINDDLVKKFSEKELKVIGDNQHNHFFTHGKFIGDYEALYIEVEL